MFRVGNTWNGAIVFIYQANLFGLFDASVDGCRSHSGLAGNLPDRHVLIQQADNFLDVFHLGGGIVFLEVFVLLSEVHEVKVGVAISLDEAVDKNVVGAVEFGTGANLHLLDVANLGVFDGLADGDAGIKEADELGGTGQVVLGDGLPAVTLGRVGDDDESEAVGAAKFDEAHHEFAGGKAFLCVFAQEGEIVHEEEADAGFGRLLDTLEDGFFDVAIYDELGRELEAAEVGGEEVPGSGVGIHVAVTQVHFRELAVNVIHFFAGVAGDFLGALDAEDGFADVGRGEDDGVLAFDDEPATMSPWLGASERFIDPTIHGSALEDAYLVGHALDLLGFLDNGFDGRNGCGEVLTGWSLGLA